MMESHDKLIELVHHSRTSYPLVPPLPNSENFATKSHKMGFIDD